MVWDRAFACRCTTLPQMHAEGWQPAMVVALDVSSIETDVGVSLSWLNLGSLQSLQILDVSHNKGLSSLKGCGLPACLALRKINAAHCNFSDAQDVSELGLVPRLFK